MLNRVINNSLIRRRLTKSFQSVVPRRADHVWVYREPMPPPPKEFSFVANVLGGFMWWWVLWHLWHDYGHVVGEFPYPDPSKWTDEELGIPPDDD